MADMLHEGEPLVARIGSMEYEDFELAATVKMLDQHFIDPKGRTVRVKSFYRIEPGEFHERNQRKEGVPEPEAPKGEGKHRHFWEKILCDIQLPLPGSGLDPIEPIGGHIRYHPEGAWYGPFEVFNKRHCPDDRIIVHCHVHTDGSAYQPFQTFGCMKEKMRELYQQRNDPWGPDWYIGFDGQLVQDENPAQAAAWEQWQQRRIQFKEPPASDDYIKLNVNAFPWYDHPQHKGVKVKPVGAFNAQGPITFMVRLEAGATLPGKVLRDHRIMAVMAGHAEGNNGQDMPERTLVFSAPGDRFPDVTAKEPTLLWFVRWLWKDNPVADFWLD
jgi:hypothetical protein